MVADFSNVQVMTGMLILLVPSVNYEAVIVTKLFEREAKGTFLFNRRPFRKNGFRAQSGSDA